MSIRECVLLFSRSVARRSTRPHLYNYSSRVFSSQTRSPDRSLPAPPSTCCGKGCAHCVWIRYAEKLALFYEDASSVREEVLRHISDPSLKAFLDLELKQNIKNKPATPLDTRK